MARQIRNGVFETNSSSSHSLVIKKKDCYVNQNSLEDEENIWIWNGKIHFSERELDFGRAPFEVLASVKKKLAYLLASYSYDEDKIAEIVDIAKDIIRCDSFEFPESRWSPHSSGLFYGSVDHQSSGMLKNFLERSGVSFREFLTNKKYIVIVDGDEYDEWGKLKDSGLIDLSEIETEVGW